MLAVLFSSVSAEYSRQQSLLEADMLAEESEAVNAGVIQGIEEDVALNSIEGEVKEANAGSSFVQVEEQIQSAVRAEKEAEQKAMMAEEQMRTAANSHQRKKAKRRLVKAQKELKLAEQRLEEVQKSFAQTSQKGDAKESDSESSSDDEGDSKSLTQQTAAIDVAQELQERENMKEFFKKSTVYKNFKAEEDKELTDRQECLETQDEIQDIHAKYDDLNKKYQSL